MGRGWGDDLEDLSENVRSAGSRKKKESDALVEPNRLVGVDSPPLTPSPTRAALWRGPPFPLPILPPTGVAAVVVIAAATLPAEILLPCSMACRCADLAAVRLDLLGVSPCDAEIPLVGRRSESARLEIGDERSPNSPGGAAEVVVEEEEERWRSRALAAVVLLLLLLVRKKVSVEADGGVADAEAKPREGAGWWT